MGVVALRAEAEGERVRCCGREEQANAHPLKEWRSQLRETIASAQVLVHLVGVGNRLRGDDAAGLEIVTHLRAELGGMPAPGLRIHKASPMPERLLSRLASLPGKIVVFDAVEASRQPGEVVFCRLGDTKYGFFATHNIPLRLVPGVAAREDDIYLVGVQPGSLEVGEGLSERVRASVQLIVATVTKGVEDRS